MSVSSFARRAALPVLIARALAALGCVAALAASGCGYSFTHGGRLPRGAESLRVAAVDNRTAQAEAGGIVGGALRDELSARGQLSAEGAAAPVAELQLVALRSATSALSGSGAFAFRLDAEVRLRVRAASGEPIYEDQALLGEDYLAGEDVVETEANRRAALRRLSRALARELVERMAAAGRFQQGR
jgi:hypothetical protein